MGPWREVVDEPKLGGKVQVGDIKSVLIAGHVNTCLGICKEEDEEEEEEEEEQEEEEKVKKGNEEEEE